MRVAEVFGPTIQGEGPYAGRLCHFLRLGGCDYRCAWCDSMHAVEPALVRQMPDLKAPEVAALLARLDPAPMLVVSGGNPALWDLSGLLPLVRLMYGRITVETQGSVWRDWLSQVDSLVVSPKPPSSGQVNARNFARLELFMLQARPRGLVLKVVVFDAADLDWARAVHETFPAVPLYLSVGTEVEDEDPVPGITDRYRWLCETVAHDPRLHDAVVLPQLHVLAWGHRVGV